ncbi:hypothetical protein [Streptomyces sp. NPDC020362]|uniref:hypothetical protein n=1 Tax=unclassified Streptomyces TaxID=2593676 RepID=UPI000A416A2C
MDSDKGPRHLLIRAHDEPSPLFGADTPGLPGPDDFTTSVAIGSLGLPDQLAHRLRSWSEARPPGGFTARPALRKHVGQGVEIGREVAAHLGPRWAVRYWDERHRSAKFVCWGCDRLHWTLEAHGHSLPPHPVHITVRGEYKWYPLRADGIGDFAPDDPALALGLSDALVAAFHAWAAAVDEALDTWIRDRDDLRHDAERARLEAEGAQLAARLADELGPDRTVTYLGC